MRGYGAWPSRESAEESGICRHGSGPAAPLRYICHIKYRDIRRAVATYRGARRSSEAAKGTCVCLSGIWTSRDQSLDESKLG